MTLAVADLQRLSILLDDALELSVPDRTRWLAALPADARPLAGTLRDLLARHAEMQTSDFAPAPEALLAQQSGGAPATGSQVGPYRLLRELGSGGMGSVWLAERVDGSLRRKVALKLPHLGWSASLAERFAREREILSTLEHPHIARLYDAGVDALARPYMALEYVEGQPIDQYCRAHGLDVPVRLRLLMQVAEAVAFAHGRLVVHRDLKPGNILVTEQGQVRLLDFGIAKLMVGDRAGETALTQAAGRMLTLDYASPEQIRGEPIGTASDVYSLGVVAYELLAGVRPYQLKRASAAELEEAIASVDAPLASSVVEAPTLKAQLRGDLDAILNTALKKRPDDRYPTVNAMAQDWRRHIEGQRVFARPDTIGYRAMRLGRRHRVPLTVGAVTLLAFGLSIGVGATALVILALLLGLGAALWQARQAREQALIAREEARTAGAVQDFVQGIFMASSGDQADPLRARQRTALELLDDGAARIESELADAPAARLRILRTLAAVYNRMGRSERAIALERQALDVARSEWPGASEQHITALSKLAVVLVGSGGDTEAMGLLGEAQKLLKQLPEVDDARLCAVQMASVEIAHRRLDIRMLPLADELVSRLLRRAPSYDLLGALLMRSALQREAGDADAAVKGLRDALAFAPQVAGGGASGLSAIHGELARSLQRAGDPAAAERHFHAAISHAESNSGHDGTYAVTLLGRLARFLLSIGRAREALVQVEDARARLERQPEGLDRAWCMLGIHGAWARTERRLGRPALALHALDVLERSGGPRLDEPLTQLGLQLNRVETLIELGRLEEAGQTLRQARDILQQKGLHAPQLAVDIALAAVHLALANDDLAAARLALDEYRSSADPNPWQRELAEAEMLLLDGRAAAAAERTEAALQQLAPVLWQPDAPWLQVQLLVVLGHARLRAGDAAGALQPLARALELDAALSDAMLSPLRLQALCAQTEACVNTGDTARARDALHQAEQIAAGHAALGPHFLQPLAAARLAVQRRP